MFKLNFSKILSDFSLRKEKTDMFICTWKLKNKKEYADFKKRIDRIETSDLSVLFDMYSLMKTCVPPEAQAFYTWFYDLISQNPARMHLISVDKQWAGEYTEKIAQCMVNRQLWLGINLKTGKVDIYTSQQKGLLMVRSGTPLEIWNRLPQYMKSHFISQTDKLLRSSKGCLLFSKLERKQLYQALAFFANVFTMAQAVFIPGFLANLYDKVVENGDTLAYCMYYFVVFDHGLLRMMKTLNSILMKEEMDESGLVLIRNCVHMLVHQSMELGAETKASWESAVEDCNPEIWKDVLFLLHKTKGKRGKKKTIRTLDEILTGNVPVLKKQIHHFLAENTDDICLAYLLRSLVRTGKVSDSLSYMTFHRAIELFCGRKIGYDIPQRRYGELKSSSFSLDPYGSSYKRAKRIMDNWTHIFAQTA